MESFESKQVLWQKTLENLDQVADNLGHPIDENIKETVAAFIVNGFPTSGSCEGHLEERFGEMLKIRPYVDIGFVEPSPRFVDEFKIRQDIAFEFKITSLNFEEGGEAWRAYWDYIQEFNPHETPEYLEARKKNEQLQERAKNLLKEFYRNRKKEMDTELAIREIGPCGEFKIESFGEDPKEIKEAEILEYKKQLWKEQDKIKAFGEFLKRKFFEQ